MKPSQLLTSLLLLSLSACGWVDSTGKQDTELPVQIDSSLVILDEGASFSINENTQRSIVFSNADKQLTQWRWTLLDSQADIQKCTKHDNFEQLNASNSLRQSCASDTDCEIKVEEVVIDNVTRFNITTPQLRSPAALEYKLTTTNKTGGQIERRQFLCAIPINDAPDARDDRFTLMQGGTLRVFGSDELSLLANDVDDRDSRNEQLSISTTPEVGPRHADNFQLFSDGGFIYKPTINAPLSNNGSISDRFVYSVSDGTNTSTATVSIKIIAFNSTPVLNTSISDISVTSSDVDNDYAFFDLSDYFTDAENDALSFTFDEASVPESGNIYITADGRLKGNPSDDDTGRYYVKIRISDGLEEIATAFYLNVLRSNGENKAPYADDIPNRTVRNQFTYDVTGSFKDADGDHLSFTATGLPAGVDITPNGVIYGTVDNTNRGVAFIRVTADDGNGGTNSDGFRLTMR